METINNTEVVNAIKELRGALEARQQDFITREKAERIAEDVIGRMHTAERKAVLPASADELMERLENFKASPRNRPEKPWTSEYGRKFGSMRNFLRAAKERLAVTPDSKAMLNEGTSSAGGYLVPTEFSAEVIRLMASSSAIMEIANILPMSSWKRQIPKQLTNVSVSWISEGSSHAETSPTFGQIEQVAKVMGAVIKCSDELLRDSAINLTQFLSELVAEAMALEIERVSLVGSTAGGDPFNGVIKTSGVNVISMGGSTVGFDDVANLVFSQPESYAKGGVIAISRGGLKKLIKLKDSNNNYIWQPPAGDVKATIWNTPYVICPQIPDTITSGAAAMTGGDLTAAVFGRFDKYLLVSPRQELEIKVSQDASAWNGTSVDSAFMQDQTWMRFTQALSIDVANGGAFSYLLFK